MSIHKRAKDMGVSDLVKKLEKLEEENEKLRESLAKEGIRMDMMNHYNKIKEENRKLKEELDKAHTAYRAVRRVNMELMNGYV